MTNRRCRAAGVSMSSNCTAALLKPTSPAFAMEFLETEILSIGTYVPDCRIASHLVRKTVAVDERPRNKSVPGFDEDALTMAVAAAKTAVSRLIDENAAGEQLDLLWCASESKPYAAKPMAATLVAALGLSRYTSAADLEFACRGGTEAFLASAQRVESGEKRVAMVVATDVAQSRPDDELEPVAGAAAAAIVLGKGLQGICRISKGVSYVSDMHDFFRRDGQEYPTHAGRFTGEPAYFHHTALAAERFFAINSVSPADFDHMVCHQPNESFPFKLAERLGFSGGKLKHSMVVNSIGNVYSATLWVAIAKTLSQCKPGETICCISYGSGAGADCFAIKATERVRRAAGRDLPSIEHTLSYGGYLRMAARRGVR